MPQPQIQLYRHQEELLNKNPHRCGIFYEMGGGKTAVAIRLAEKNGDSCLVVCPKSLREQWEAEIEKFKTKNIEWHVITKEQFKKQINELYEFDCVIADECHIGFANYKSQLHRAMALYIKRYNPKCLYLLTGTPYTSTCWSIYSLGKLLGYDWNWWQWKNRYFYSVQMGSRIIPIQRKGIEKEMATLTNRIGYVKRLDELADIPEQTFLTEYFDLNRDQTKAIDALTDVQAIVRWTKIHQIEGGSLKSDGYTENLIIDCEKTKRVLELTETSPKIAIVARYNLQLDTYHSLLAKKFPSRKIFKINGETEDKNAVVDKINASDDAIVLINSMCSVGFNLWSVPIMVFASLDFSYTNYKQMCGRLLRMNHLKKNVYIHLITSGQSVDKAVQKCMTNKKDFTAEIMSHEKYERNR